MRIKVLPTTYMFYSIICVLKIYLVRILLYDDFNILRTLRLEWAPLLFLFVFAEMVGKKLKSFFYVLIDLVFSMILLAIVLYHNQFGRILNYESIYLITYIGHVQQSLKELFNPGYLVFFLDIPAILFLMLLGRHPYKYVVLTKAKFAQLILFALSLSFLNIYGQWGNEVNITKFAQSAGIMNAEGVQIYHELKENFKTDPGLFSMEHISTLKDISQEKSLWGKAQGENLIVIQLESLQNFVTGLKINGQEITPNLNRLMLESFYFPNFYSQIGQGNTSDAEFAFNTSVYPLENGAISSSYKDKNFPSLPKILREFGYRSYTFHVNEISFWNRDKLYAGLGYDKAFDKSFFGSEDIIGMGPSDEVLYRKALPELLKLKDSQQKFYANFISLTCHHPYIIPPERVELDLPVELKGTLSGNYLLAVHYADAALGKFISSLKETGLWDESTLVIYGDHFGLNSLKLEVKDQEILSGLLGRPYDILDMFNVPFMIHVPGLSGQTVKVTGGQIDAFPTLTNLLGISLGNQIRFGEDLLNNQHNVIALRYYFPEGSFINDQFLYLSDTKKARSLTTHEEFALPGEVQKSEEDVKELIKLSDGYLRSLPERN